MLTHPHTPHGRLALVALMALLGLVLLPRQAVQAADIPTLITQLHDADAGMRLEAAEALGRRDDARAVDALIAALRDSDPTVRAQVAMSLGELGAPRAIGPLKAALRDEFILVSTQAVTALAKIKTPQAVDPLLLLVRDLASPLCAPAAEALGLTGDARAVPFLLAALNARDPGVRQAAARGAVAFIKGRQPIADALLAQLKDADEGVRCAAIDLLTEHEIPGAATAIIAIANDPSATIRLNALRALQTIATPGIDEVLLAALHDDGADVRAMALGGVALWETVDLRAVPDLLALANADDASVRAQAITALCRCDTPEADAAVITALHDANGQVRQAAVRGVRQTNSPRVREALLDIVMGIVTPPAEGEDDETLEYDEAPSLARRRLLDDKDAELTTLALNRLPKTQAGQRLTLYTLLGLLGDSLAIDPLIAELQRTKEKNEQGVILQAISRIKDPRAVTVLIHYLKEPEMQREIGNGFRRQGIPAVQALLQVVTDPDPALAKAAVQALRMCDIRNATGILLQALQDEDARVRRAAALTLASYGDARSADVLVTLLNDDDVHIREQVIFTLGSFNDPRAADALAALQTHDQYGTRAEAAVLLAGLGDPRAVDALLKAVNDKPQPGRSAAITALAHLKDPRAIDGLIAALRLPEPMTSAPTGAAQPAIIGALLQSNDPRATTALVEHLQALLRPELVNAGLHPETLPGLAAELSRQRPYLELLANELRYSGPVCTEPFVAALADTRPYIRVAALAFLAGRHDPSLLPVFLQRANDDNTDVRLVAIRALVGLGDARTLPTLLTGLKDASPAVRDAAAEALGDLGDRRAVEPLLAAYNAGVRPALPAMAQLGDARALEVLIAGTKAEEWRLRNISVTGLGRLAFDLHAQQNTAGISRCITTLGSLLTDADTEEEEWWNSDVLSALSNFKDPRAVQAIVRSINEMDDDVELMYYTENCLEALQEIGTPEAMTALMKLYRKKAREDGEGIQHLLQQLAQCNDETALALLRTFVTAGDAETSTMAADVLAARLANRSIGELLDAYVKEVTPRKDFSQLYAITDELRERLKEDPACRKEVALRCIPLLTAPDVQTYSRMFLSTITLLGATREPSAVDALLPLLDSKQGMDAMVVITALGASHDPRVLEPLLALVHGPENSMRSEAIEALAELADPRACDAFLEILAEKTTDLDNKRVAIRGLGHIGDTRATDALLGLYATPADESQRVLQYLAMEQLGECHDPRAVPVMVAALQDMRPVYMKYTSFENDYYQMYLPPVAAAGLGALGDPQAVEPLIAALATGTLDFRMLVATSLGALKDPRAIPALIAAMERFAGEARHVPAEALTAITGQQLGDDPARWRAWWAAQQAK